MEASEERVMPAVLYILPDGSERRADLAEGTSVMLGAIQHNINGIEAECGGSCACATCHVYVDPAFLARLAPPSATEEELLTVVAAERKPNSRLSCQLPISADLDGLIVRIPETQLL
jgi:ferredoxin, 2Fe-2S